MQLTDEVRSGSFEDPVDQNQPAGGAVSTSAAASLRTSRWTDLHFIFDLFLFVSFPLFITLHRSSSAKKFRKVVGKETCSETLESTSMLEKEKFPQDYFPEVGSVRNTWNITVLNDF